MFRLAMPKEWGGPELSTIEQIVIIEELSKANAAVGWCVPLSTRALGASADGGVSARWSRSGTAGSATRGTTSRQGPTSPRDGLRAAGKGAGWAHVGHPPAANTVTTTVTQGAYNAARSRLE